MYLLGNAIAENAVGRLYLTLGRGGLLEATVVEVVNHPALRPDRENVLKAIRNEYVMRKWVFPAIDQGEVALDDLAGGILPRLMSRAHRATRILVEGLRGIIASSERPVRERTLPQALPLEESKRDFDRYVARLTSVAAAEALRQADLEQLSSALL